MSWTQNGNGNGQQQRSLKIPDPGKGRLRIVDKAKARDPAKAPDFRGLINCDGHIMWVSIWYNAPKQGERGMMPEGWSVACQTYDANQQLAQQQMQYVPQPSPMPQPQPQQGYTPAPGYQPPPPPQGQPPQAPVQPQRWGGTPGQPQQQGGYTKKEVPF